MPDLLNSPLTQTIDPNYLHNLALTHRQAYAQASPFPHIVIDDFLPAPWLEQILDEFPQPGAIDWQSFDATSERKLASKSEHQMGPMTRWLLYQFNASTVLKFLEILTGIEGLIPDPHLMGGGLHQIERGGYLKIHADFNRHPQLRLDRRLNFLLYLNQDWPEAYGGHLQLWDPGMTQCVQKILPIFNRCVIFSTTDYSYHGHPDPLTCPAGQTRKSLALYYYSNGRPASELAQADPHSTLFRARPGEALKSNPNWKQRAKTMVKQLVPPHSPGGTEVP